MEIFSRHVEAQEKEERKKEKEDEEEGGRRERCSDARLEDEGKYQVKREIRVVCVT